MGYFIDKIRMLKKYPFKDYQLYLSYLIAIYELFPLIDCGRFKEASIQIENNWGEVLDKEYVLPSHNRAIISLYIALTYFGLGKYREALQRLNRLLFLSKKITFIPLYRTIRLVKLMILFELDELEDYDFEVRSFKRSISKITKAYKVEHVMLHFLDSGKSLILNKEKKWPKIQIQLSEISNDVYEKQILRLFDFTAWIEAKMTNTDLSYVIQVHRKSKPKSD